MHHRARYPLLAVLLGFITPGLGHVYVGRGKRFCVPAFAVVVLLIVLGFVGALSSFAGMAAFLVALAGLYLFSIVDPLLLARRLEVFVPKWYNRWYVYLGWIGMLLGLSVLLSETREPLLGYSTFRVPTPAMSPTIEPREVILVNTRAFQHETPMVGDVVVVRGSQTGNFFIRRISAQSHSSISLVNDNPLAVGRVDQLANVSPSNFLGRVTYVLYSPNLYRIGLRVK